ncbi:hypothetical protein CROQUDRAFT_275844 [Cronartium quercuum f. sp. fusiforme G11]|uniref:Uncharacterized protein n=1 Tax=Cronartium quercuum f. sp. fusiforme G11 TaxID=708437 RepID=A0A9P6NPJ4_9BASI|nr:hypothetical protein CROQUDRAFT_275844 [Cronartium quercuum f. sp. fusiforme G11]
MYSMHFLFPLSLERESMYPILSFPQLSLSPFLFFSFLLFLSFSLLYTQLTYSLINTQPNLHTQTDCHRPSQAHCSLISASLICNPLNPSQVDKTL